MQVDTKSLAENLREIAKRPSPGTDTRSHAEYADAQYHGAAGEW